MVQQDWPQISTWRTRIAKNTLITCNTYCFVTTTIVTKSACLLRYKYIACIALLQLHYLQFSTVDYDTLKLFFT